MTVRDIVYRSLRILGVLAAGEVPTAAEAQDALTAINSMLASWSNNGLLIYETKRETFPVVLGQQTFTFGTGGDFNSQRPIQIVGASYLLNGVEYVIDLVELDNWNAISDKNINSIPDKLYYQPSFPLGKVNLYPKPESNAQIIISSLKPLPKFASINDTVELPEGYERLIAFNGAKEIAPEYQKSLTVEANEIALQSKIDLERTNYKPIIAAPDIAGLSETGVASYNIIRGY